MRDLNMNEIDAVSGADRGDATAIGAAGFGVAGAVEGAKIGGSMGTFGGPIGAVVGGLGGAVVGGAIGYAAYELGSRLRGFKPEISFRLTEQPNVSGNSCSPALTNQLKTVPQHIYASQVA